MLAKASQYWIRTIEDGQGYTSVSLAAFQTMLKKVVHFVPYKVLLRYTKPEATVLDAGCGWGLASFALAAEHRHVTALDISPKLIAHLKTLQLALGRLYQTHLTLTIGGIFDFPMTDKTIDAVYSDGTYEHFLHDDERKKILQNMYAVLREKGTVIITVPNVHNPFFSLAVDHKMPPMYPFTLQSLSTELVEAGFHVVEHGFYFVNPGYAQWTKASWMIPCIAVANVVFPLLPRWVKAIFGVHFYCVAHKR